MRPQSRRAGVVAGALCLTTGAAAVPAAAHAASQGTTIHISDRSPTVGDRTLVTGRDPGAVGNPVVLQLRPPGGTWVTLASATAGNQGRFRFRIVIPQSGALRAVVGPPPGTVSAFAASGTGASPAKHVTVRRDVRVRHRRLQVRAGNAAVVVGKVSPAVAGLPVKLQIRREGRWRTLDRDETGARGRYRLRDRQVAAGSLPVRVMTGSATGLGRGLEPLGRLNVFRYANVSWYGPGLYGGHLACGGTLTPGTLGVAHKTLPCGTKVTLRNGGRTIRVRVIDRGPYVGGREYDLTAATAQRLGFQGAGPILVTR